MDGKDDHETFNLLSPGGGVAKPTTRYIGDGSESFDPRTWVLPPDAAPPPRTPIERTRRSHIAFGIGDRVRAVGAGLAVATIGAAVAWSAHPVRSLVDGHHATAADAGRSPRRAVGGSSTILIPGIEELLPNLEAAGFAPADVAAVSRRAEIALGSGPGEIRVSFRYFPQGNGLRLDRLAAARLDGKGIVLTRRPDNGFAEAMQKSTVVRRLRIVRGELDAQSFYSSAVAAGVNDAIVGDFANAFQFDFDLQREVSPGDIFEAGIEQGYNSAGEEVGPPILVYASLATAAKTRALYRLHSPDGTQAEWFDSNGRSTRRSLMRTPVEAARISSGFGMRSHPILGYAKLHRGTDFAAPTGTPIYAAGDAVVVFAGLKGPNGNFVKLHHDNGWETLYLHMNRILPGVVAGLRVGQGQAIGEVGTTGRSTGPHLHYEVHIDGQPVNPLSIDTGTGKSLLGFALAAFRKARDAIDAKRAAVN